MAGTARQCSEIQGKNGKAQAGREGYAGTRQWEAVTPFSTGEAGSAEAACSAGQRNGGEGSEG